MQVRILAFGVVLMFIITACSRENSEDTAAADSGQPRHVWKEQVKALDKAKHLEDDMNAAFEKRAREMDQQAR